MTPRHCCLNFIIPAPCLARPWSLKASFRAWVWATSDGDSMGSGWKGSGKSKQAAQNGDGNEQIWDEARVQVQARRRSPPEEAEDRSVELPRAEASLL